MAEQGDKFSFRITDPALAKRFRSHLDRTRIPITTFLVDLIRAELDQEGEPVPLSYAEIARRLIRLEEWVLEKEDRLDPQPFIDAVESGNDPFPEKPPAEVQSNAAHLQKKKPARKRAK